MTCSQNRRKSIVYGKVYTLQPTSRLATLFQHNWGMCVLLHVIFKVLMNLWIPHPTTDTFANLL